MKWEVKCVCVLGGGDNNVDNKQMKSSKAGDWLGLTDEG
jgi:hypothetical protein